MPSDEESCGDHRTIASISSTINVLQDSFVGIHFVHNDILDLDSKVDKLSSWFNMCNGSDVVF